MNHARLAKEQLIHIAFGALFFVVIGVFAVVLDLLANWVSSLRVSQFTSAALGLTAHALLVIDLVLFFVYLVVTSLELIKGMKE
jgi:H+/Cl- antiporter ClcA